MPCRRLTAIRTKQTPPAFGTAQCTSGAVRFCRNTCYTQVSHGWTIITMEMNRGVYLDNIKGFSGLQLEISLWGITDITCCL